ncbi:MAG: hypothetical protein FJ100_03265 [Deltaproteobacteria bacterium]|nr:hypothetical protein [Deltaproteobacteria bacterium]
MQDFLLPLHSLLRWVALGDVAAAALLCALALRSLPEWRPIHKITALVGLIAMDLQLLVGGALWLRSPLVQAARADMGAAMKEPVLRFFAVEHAAMMLLAVVAVHIGYARAKRAADGAQAHKAVAIGYGLAVILLLAGIPWPMRAGVARPWLVW